MILSDMNNNQHFEAIKEFYGSRCANRSGIQLINHITEGLFILDMIGASQKAKEAYCIHPMLQSDLDLSTSLDKKSIFSSYKLDQSSVVLAMEYRAVANSYLSSHYESDSDKINLSVVKCVNDMLIADKIQNRKDFDTYHLGTHENSDTLKLYFNNWLRVLDVSEVRYTEILSLLSNNS